LKRSNLCNVKFKNEEVLMCHKNEKVVELKGGKTLKYDYLISSLGAETSFYGIKGMKKHALVLRDFEDGLLIRNNLIDLFRKMKGEELSRKIVIVGAGPSGVEISTEIQNFINRFSKKDLDYLDKCSVSIVDSKEKPLSGISSLSHGILMRLNKLGVKTYFNQDVEEVSPKSLKFTNGESLKYDVLIWTGGVRADLNRLILGGKQDGKGRIFIDNDLKMRGNKEIFVIGDSSAFQDSISGEYLPMTAWAAMNEAKIAADNIINLIKNNEEIKYIPPKKWPVVVTLGGSDAIGIVSGFIVKGRLGYFLHRMIGLKYFLYIFPTMLAIKIWARGVFILHKNN